MEIINKREFTQKYNKRTFYSIMGKFFAEKKYKKELPYLDNADTYEWRLFYSGKRLAGFYSLEQKKGFTKIGNIYVIEDFRKVEVYESIIADIMTIDGVVKIITNDINWISILTENGFTQISARGVYKTMEVDNEQKN